ncbi:MAG: V/A-type H+/Na+-transporting ATPase subunit, partial [Methanolobus sp.]|nr:V/A-type H+/Na+-transporting ATPase subunit [Methanolobus sp.]
MGVKDVKPTRSELIELKKKIKLSQSGHKLLKMKRDGLILEFFEILGKAKDVRTELDAAYEVASRRIAIAEAVDGVITVKSTSFALQGKPEIELESRNIMGVVVPKIESSSVHK